MGDRVQFQLSVTRTPTWTVYAKRTEDQKKGDSRDTYQLAKDDGTLYNDGEWVAQNRLLDTQ